jgi:hypothetical protein
MASLASNGQSEIGSIPSHGSDGLKKWSSLPNLAFHCRPLSLR